jgi:hypothetical protein
MPRGAAKAPDRAYLHAQLAQFASHDPAGPGYRDTFRSSHLTQNIPAGFWFTVFPPDATGERLLSEGKTLIVPDARLIAEDASENQAVRDTAAFYYGYFDEPWYLRWLAGKSYPSDSTHEDIMNGPDSELHSKLRELLPSLPPQLDYPHWNLTSEWLKHELDIQPEFGALVLARFDQIMHPDLPSGKDGLIEQDRRLVKWFNRLNDVDIDEWLTVHAPKSLEYRQRTLRETGVDPLTAYADQAVDAERRGLLFKALPAGEAQQCLDLLNEVFPNNIDDPRKRPPQTDAKWRERVCAWYWAHRKEFTYDPALRRFVLPTSETSKGR